MSKHGRTLVKTFSGQRCIL